LRKDVAHVGIAIDFLVPCCRAYTVRNAHSLGNSQVEFNDLSHVSEKMKWESHNFWYKVREHYWMPTIVVVSALFLMFE
jgi:hypothetical protein